MVTQKSAGIAAQPAEAGAPPALGKLAAATRATTLRHAWTLGSLTGVRVGPNGLRHIEQSLQAVAGLDLPTDSKLELLSIVDDYVSGHCAGLVRRRSQARLDRQTARALNETMTRALGAGHYPQLRALIGARQPVDVFMNSAGATTEDHHFELGLEALLDGLARRFKLK